MNRSAILAALLVLPGCTAVSAVTNIATMPVRAASKAVDAGSTLVDATTTSQSERDERRGRQLREQEERLGELDRAYRTQSVACDQGDSQACARRDAAWRELEALSPGQPYRDE
jgi:hypothetical protein